MLIGDGDQKPLLETEVKKLHLEKYVIFAGKIHHTRLIAYYNLADIFILPSVRDEEGNLDDQSVSVMEAMACERAVVTSDLPGYKLVITHKKNGMLVQEKNIPKLAEALLTLVASSKMRLSMGKAARKTIREKFSWKQIGKEYTEFFKSL